MLVEDDTAGHFALITPRQLRWLAVLALGHVAIVVVVIIEHCTILLRHDKLALLAARR